MIQRKFSNQMDMGGKDKTPFVTNDGGQKLPGVEWGAVENYSDLLQNFKTAKVLAQGFGSDYYNPDYSYLKGDITDAYSSKVEDVKRSFVFLNLKNDSIPAVTIVFDKVISSDETFKKTWLLHSIEEPIIKKNETTIVRTKNGDNGKLINTTLLPKLSDAQITTIGGPGNEFWVNGKNYKNDATTRPDPANDRGAWRIELSPKKAKKENYFFNVMQVMDAKYKKKLEVSLIDDTAIVGVHVGDRVVVFSKNSEAITRSFSFTIEGAQLVKILVSDLTSDTWRILKDGEVYIPTISVNPTDGLLYFEGTAATYEFSRK